MDLELNQRLSHGEFCREPQANRGQGHKGYGQLFIASLSYLYFHGSHRQHYIAYNKGQFKS